MLKLPNNFFSQNSNPQKISLLLGVIALIVYLTARNSGLYPMVFADEWLYSAYSRYLPAEGSVRPSYLYFYIYGLTTYCGSAFLDCARQINVLFFALSVPLIYAVCRRFASANLSVFVSACAVFSPINSYSAYFMPESMYFFFFWLLTWCVVKGYEARPILMAAGAATVLACMSLVKPHAVFLFPALLASLFSGWIFDRNKATFKQSCRLAAILIAVFLLVRLPAGFFFAGSNGLSIMGNDYGGIASDMSGPDYLISLLPMAGFNLWGHVLTLAVLFGVPLALLLQMSIKGSENYSEAQRRQRYLGLYTGTLLISLLIIVALFAAKAVSMGPYESIGRLSLRHYNFTFPLLLIVAASALAPTVEKSTFKFSAQWSFFVIAGLVVYAFIYRFKGYLPILADSPELRSITKHMTGFLILCSVGLAGLLISVFNKRKGARFYLLILIPLTIITSASNVSKEFSSRLNPDVYDQAGKFVNQYLGKDTAKLVIFGPDLASLYRTHFYMSTAETLFFAIPNGQPLDPKLIPEDKEWLLLIGNYQYPYTPIEKIHILVKNAEGDVAGAYTLLRLSYPTSLQITPGKNTQHQIGRFDPASNSMLSEKSEAGALMFGPYAELQPGLYEATYAITAEAEVDGTEVGTLDVSGYIAPGTDDRLRQTPLKSAHGQQMITLRFEANNTSYKYQFRVWTNGNAARVSIKSVNVKRL